MTTPNAGKSAEKVDLSSISGGNVKLYGHSGKWLEFLEKLTDMNNMIHAPGDLPQRNQNDIHTKAYS